MIPVKDNIPLLRFPIVTVALVLGLIVVYVLSILHGGSFFGGPSRHVALQYGAIPAQLTLGSAFSSIFLHGSFLALLANLIALAIFGLNLEDALGRLRYLAFFLLGGIVSLGLLALFAPNSTVPVLGASGAVAAVLGGYLVLYPRARVVSLALIPFLATIVELPALLLLGLWLIVQVWFGLAGLTGPVHHDWGVAFAAQLGAFMLGALSVPLFAQRERLLAKRPPPRPVY
ncbi:MAG TPA: rhomboid family intramembrane serine protease [Solirubrobacteraceae bacterium]|nr:rhomboid family intramembrane serine protease [Solirubrobacteraceae bacterium]